MAVPRSRTVLVTGPIGRTEPWAEAVRRSGWEAAVRELVAVVPGVLPAAELAVRPDWVCVTSKHALPALAAHAGALAGVRAACVGEATARAAGELGLAVVLPPARDAAELARLLLERAAPGAVVLWPRGSLSDELARALAAGGLAVRAPVVYETVELPRTGPLPAADAVFLASPSGARAWLRSARGAPPLGVAIGASTAAAMRAGAGAFSAILALPRPEPEELGRLLSDLPPLEP